MAHWLVAGWLALGLTGIVALGWVSVTTPTPPASGESARGIVPATGPVTKPANAATLRVATFNIHSGRGPDGRVDLARTARAMRGFDLVAMNEVAGAPGVIAGTHQAAQLGQMLKMGWIFAPTERRWGQDDFGNALLTRRPIGQWRRIPLTGEQTHGFRNILMADVPFNGQRVHVLITHLTRGPGREKQLSEALRMFTQVSAPALLMGDLNSPVGDPRLRELIDSSQAIDALAAAGEGELTDHIDWILVRGMRVKAAGVIDHGASDHPLVWAEVVPVDASP